MREFKVRVKTEACDVYKLTFDHEPTNEEIAKEVWLMEGKCADLDFYIETISYELEALP